MSFSLSGSLFQWFLRLSIAIGIIILIWGNIPLWVLVASLFFTFVFSFQNPQ